MMVIPDTVVVADVSVVHPAAARSRAAAARRPSQQLQLRTSPSTCTTRGPALGGSTTRCPCPWSPSGIWASPLWACPMPWLRDSVERGGLQERTCDERAPVAQRRAVQGQQLHVWGVPVHGCPRHRAGVPARAARVGGGVSLTAAAVYCGACGAKQFRALTFDVQYRVVSVHAPC
jgi:hypothetical protein